MLVFLWWMQDKTRVGAIIRAGMDNKEMTRSLGINYGLVSTLVFLFGAALAGFAGIIGTPVLGAYPSMGDALLLLTPPESPAPTEPEAADDKPAGGSAADARQ